MHTPLQSAIKSVLYRHKHHPKSWEQLQYELLQLQQQTNRVTRLQKEIAEYDRAASERLKAEIAERDRAAAAPTQQQQEPQALTNEQIYKIAQDPQKWSQLLQELEPQLINLIH